MIMLIRCCDDQDILHLDNIDIMFASNKLALENIHHLLEVTRSKLLALVPIRLDHLLDLSNKVLLAIDEIWLFNHQLLPSCLCKVP